LPDNHFKKSYIFFHSFSFKNIKLLLAEKLIVSTPAICLTRVWVFSDLWTWYSKWLWFIYLWRAWPSGKRNVPSDVGFQLPLIRSHGLELSLTFIWLC